MTELTRSDDPYAATQAALLAAVQPAKTQALYFVAKGDGSSHFSASLDEHNRAVNRYQRGIQTAKD